MLKFLARIQFSIEMTMWLTVLAVFLRFTWCLYEVTQTSSGRFALPIATGYIWRNSFYSHVWLAPILFFIMAIVELKFSIPKWLQWLLRMAIFFIILIAILLSELPFKNITQGWHSL